MNPKEYTEQAHQTMSPNFHSERVDIGLLVNSLSAIVSWSDDLDRMKKGMFYNREGKLLEPDSAEANKAMFNVVLSNLNPDYGKAVATLHGIIGIITEAGELAQALLEVIKHPKNPDIINIREEVGDLLWYEAILLEAIGSGFEDTMEINIKKLRARFPNKFTEYDALNRDLNNERKTLE